ncbi:MAG TPA: AAA family ATPase [Herpetosiphonaceae bacterium]
MSDLVFIQMSGAPGAGKTTLAHAIAKQINAVVIDHDVTKSAMLEADVPPLMAGRASYVVLAGIARHLLQQGLRVICDSPCFYGEVLERGQRVAKEVGAEYRYIECVVTDLDELDRRLTTRLRLPSQLAGVRVPPTEGSGRTQAGDTVFKDWIANMKRPDSNYLVLDTTRPLQVYLQEAIAYIKTGNGSA